MLISAYHLNQSPSIVSTIRLLPTVAHFYCSRTKYPDNSNLLNTVIVQTSAQLRERAALVWSTVKTRQLSCLRKDSVYLGDVFASLIVFGNTRSKGFSLAPRLPLWMRLETLLAGVMFCSVLSLKSIYLIVCPFTSGTFVYRYFELFSLFNNVFFFLWKLIIFWSVFCRV